jgi:hypothetical protein
VAYHKDFWLAVAAAAPIIALATQVAVTQSFGSAFFFRRVRRRSTSAEARRFAARGWKVAVIGYFVSYGNVVMQGVALAIALVSLDRGEDYTQTATASLLLILGLIVVIISALASAAISGNRERLDELRQLDERKQLDDLKQLAEEFLAEFQAQSGPRPRARSRILKSAGVSGGRGSRRR